MRVQSRIPLIWYSTHFIAVQQNYIVLSLAMGIAHLSIEASSRKQAMPTLTWWSLQSY